MPSPLNGVVTGGVGGGGGVLVPGCVSVLPLPETTASWLLDELTDDGKFTSF